MTQTTTTLTMEDHEMQNDNPIQTPEPSVMLTTQELANMLGLNTTTLTDWRNKDRGPTYYYISPNEVRYLRTEVMEWLMKVRVVPKDAGKRVQSKKKNGPRYLLASSQDEITGDAA